MAVLKYKTSGGTYTTLTNYSVNSPSVLQTLGTSTTAVMSQDASTKLFAINETFEPLISLASELIITTATTEIDLKNTWKEYAKRCIVVTINDSSKASILSTSLPYSGGLIGGKNELHLIISNNTTTDISIALPVAQSSVVACNGDVLNIKAKTIGEINIIATAESNEVFYRVG